MTKQQASQIRFGWSFPKKTAGKVNGSDDKCD